MLALYRNCTQSCHHGNTAAHGQSTLTKNRERERESVCVCGKEMYRCVQVAHMYPFIIHSSTPVSVWRLPTVNFADTYTHTWDGGAMRKYPCAQKYESSTLQMVGEKETEQERTQVWHDSHKNTWAVKKEAITASNIYIYIQPTAPQPWRVPVCACVCLCVCVYDRKTHGLTPTWTATVTEYKY